MEISQPLRDQDNISAGEMTNPIADASFNFGKLHSPGPLPEVRVDNCKVKVGAAAPGLRVHLLDQTSQLLQGGVHPCVDLQLVLGCLTYGKELCYTVVQNQVWLSSKLNFNPYLRPKKGPIERS